MKLRRTEKLGRVEAKAGAGGWHAGTHRHGHRPTERGGRQRKHTPRRAEEDTGDNRELGSLTGPVTFLPADSPPDLHRLPSLQPWRPFRTPACISTQGEASWSSASTTAGVIPRSLGNWAHLPLRRRGLPVVPQGCGWSSQRFCASIINSISFKPTGPTIPLWSLPSQLDVALTGGPQGFRDQENQGVFTRAPASLALLGRRQKTLEFLEILNRIC